ncbi:MAG: hypothetical protein QOJ29_2996 [Thermoleophilaceae bacterium]|nr:hypothetical protein [Thermoleophilaceae bacterium]
MARWPKRTGPQMSPGKGAVASARPIPLRPPPEGRGYGVPLTALRCCGPGVSLYEHPPGDNPRPGADDGPAAHSAQDW